MPMDQTPPSLPGAASPSQSSLIGRMMNVFASPVEVFDDVKHGPARVTNWLVPVALVVSVTIASFALIFSQPAVQQQVREMQEKILDQQVAAGKIKPEQAKQAKEFFDNMPPWVLQIVGIVQGVISGFFSALWWALVVW